MFIHGLHVISIGSNCWNNLQKSLLNDQWIHARTHNLYLEVVSSRLDMETSWDKLLAHTQQGEHRAFTIQVINYRQ